MEFMEGETLHSMLCEMIRLPEEAARFYSAEIVLAVSFLHRCGIVHRDIKPRNIPLDRDGHCKLGDFRLCQVGIFNGKLASSPCGTKPYAAPEILKCFKVLMFWRKKKINVSPTMVDVSVSTEGPSTRDVGTNTDDVIIGGEINSHEAPPPAEYVQVLDPHAPEWPEPYSDGALAPEYEEWGQSYSYCTSDPEYEEWCPSYSYGAPEYEEWGQPYSYEAPEYEELGQWYSYGAPATEYAEWCGTYADGSPPAYPPEWSYVAPL